MLRPTIMVLCASASNAFAWQLVERIEIDDPQYPFATSDNQEVVLIREAAVNPNATTSVPVFFGGNANVTFRVNVTDLALPGLELPVLESPREVATTWDLSWPSGTTWDDITDDPANISCITTFPSHIDGLKGDVSNGNCTGALGAECVAALTNGLGSCEAELGSGFDVPDACAKAFGFGGILSFTSRMPNGTDDSTSPVTIYMEPGFPTAAGNRSLEQQFKMEERIHFALFRDGFEQPTGYPVCVRISSGAFSGKFGVAHWASVAVAGVVASMLL